MRDAHDVVGDGPCAVPRDPEGFALAFVFSSVSSAFICGRLSPLLSPLLLPFILSILLSCTS